MLKKAPNTEGYLLFEKYEKLLRGLFLAANKFA